MSNPNSPIAKFTTKVRTASNRGSKDLTLSMQEAIELSLVLTQVFEREAILLQDIVDLQRKLADGPTEIIIDGGRDN